MLRRTTEIELFQRVPAGLPFGTGQRLQFQPISTHYWYEVRIVIAVNEVGRVESHSRFYYGVISPQSMRVEARNSGSRSGSFDRKAGE